MPIFIEFDLLTSYTVATIKPSPKTTPVPVGMKAAEKCSLLIYTA